MPDVASRSRLDFVRLVVATLGLTGCVFVLPDAASSAFVESLPMGERDSGSQNYHAFIGLGPRYMDAGVFDKADRQFGFLLDADYRPDGSPVAWTIHLGLGREMDGSELTPALADRESTAREVGIGVRRYFEGPLRSQIYAGGGAAWLYARIEDHTMPGGSVTDRDTDVGAFIAIGALWRYSILLYGVDLRAVRGGRGEWLGESGSFDHDSIMFTVGIAP